MAHQVDKTHDPRFNKYDLKRMSSPCSMPNGSPNSPHAWATYAFSRVCHRTNTELSARLGDLYKNVAHRFAASLSELVERYANTLEECQSEVDALEARVKQHLSDMGI